MPGSNNLHQRISDYSRCPQCVADQRVGYASAYFNYEDQLFAVCKRHATKWLVTGRALLHPSIPDLSEFPDLAYAFDRVEPYQPSLSTPAGMGTIPRPPSAARQRAQARAKAPRRVAGRPTPNRPVSEPPSAAREGLLSRGNPGSRVEIDAERFPSPSKPATTRHTSGTKREGFPTEIRTRRVLLDEGPSPYPAG
jgi:hypothetical protein